MKVAVLGASGFVGRALIDRLVIDKSLEIRALCRHPPAQIPDLPHQRLEWVACDLHNLKDLEQSLAQIDVAIYLVHSMLPTARLNQGHFANFDLILADNFVRAAEKQGVKHVIYLTGLVPDKPMLSEHLKSRLEVERTFRNTLHATCLRTGMIIGSAGSSFNIVLRLVHKLPLMVCPQWAKNRSQVISLSDVLELIYICIRSPSVQGKVWDIGVEPALTYEQMLRKTAELLGLRRLVVVLPYISHKFSKLWVRLITGAPRNLVYPLIDSLESNMIVRPDHKFPAELMTFQGFAESVLKEATGDARKRKQKPHAFERTAIHRKQNYVRSIQRLPLPAGKRAEWVAEEYIRFLPKFLPLLLAVERDGSEIKIRLRGLRLVILCLQHSQERSRPDRQLFYVTGGILFKPAELKARLEIREVLKGECCLVALHDFHPALPWMIYVLTQAQTHRWFMYRFSKYLRKQAN